MNAAATQANTLDAEGYDVMWTFSVVAQHEGNNVQAIYLLAKKREDEAQG